MNQEHKPLYTLTIEEFISLTRKLIAEALAGNTEEQKSHQHAQQTEEMLSTVELTAFLRCSKVSIHNYKKLGLPFYKIGRKLLFKKAEVLNFMKTIKHRRFLKG